MTWRRAIFLGAVLGFLGVMAGAFGSHALRGRLSADDLRSFEVGVRYQIYHALWLVAVGLLLRQAPLRSLRWATGSVFVGTLFFSGSIYGLVLLDWKWLFPVTPAGGALLMLGWLLLALAALRNPSTTASQES